jgi:hypothetical protein
VEKLTYVQVKYKANAKFFLIAGWKVGEDCFKKWMRPAADASTEQTLQHALGMKM